MQGSDFRVAIVAKYSFPHGMAAMNRIITYSKGLIAGSVGVTYYCCMPPTPMNSDYAPESEYEGIKCYYARPKPWLGSRYVGKIIKIYSHAIHALTLARHHRKSPYKFLFISSDSPLFMAWYAVTGTLLGIKTVFISDEYPTPIRAKLKDRIPGWKTAAYKIIDRWIYCRVMMTEALRDYFNTQIAPKPTHILPSITDIERFDCDYPRRLGSVRQLCYMGNMELAKDNVDNIIRAFAIIIPNYPDLELCLYGTPSVTDRKRLEGIIADLGIEKVVFIKPRVNFDDVAQILRNAYILVASQPNTKRAEGGFPTKLGEYLMSGTPAILTNVGEISKYITDGDNAWMVEPENPTTYATKLRYIIENYDKALQVAERGKQYVIDNFGSTAVARELKLFLENV